MIDFLLPLGDQKSCWSLNVVFLEVSSIQHPNIIYNFYRDKIDQIGHRLVLVDARSSNIGVGYEKVLNLPLCLPVMVQETFKCENEFQILSI